MAGLALAAGQSPYDIARLLDEYPDVFDAYFWRVMTRAEDAAGQPQAGGFKARRERTRAERIRRLSRR